MNRTQRTLEAIEFVKQILIEISARDVRSEELTLSAEENDRPLFVKAAERVAKRRGSTADHVLDSISQRLQQPGYPTKDCLSPFEIDKFKDWDEIPSDREQHAKECSFCLSLLCAQPKPELLEEFKRAANSGSLSAAR